jgi:hypothetical protein
MRIQNDRDRSNIGWRRTIMSWYKDEGGQPMGEAIPQPQKWDLAIGDRIHIRHGSRIIPNLVGQVGTVIEVFRIPLGSCLVRIDGDPDRQREWFFYRDEVATSDA